VARAHVSIRQHPHSANKTNSVVLCETLD
jgi:hypothetical protein